MRFAKKLKIQPLALLQAESVGQTAINIEGRGNDFWQFVRLISTGLERMQMLCPGIIKRDVLGARLRPLAKGTRIQHKLLGGSASFCSLAEPPRYAWWPGAFCDPTLTPH